MTEPSKPTPRPPATVGIWPESLELLDRICVSNRTSPTRSHRGRRAQVLQFLIAQECVRLGLIEATD